MSADAVVSRVTRAERPDPSTTAKIQAAQKLHAQATEHKREAARHRRRARLAMERFNAFRSELEAMGIEVVLETPSHSSEEHSDTSSQGSNT